ncbi:unnamed protein product [Pocillopora meandrina]|uniref:Uncharacterized protein n=1 Tax=Pocillopora meandrina TaxID=46732 RepID=A0AAU9X0X3_9CNID|nr:unnamed protein product [Pocillopora meandrina]
MTIRRIIIQWNESRTSCSPYNTNFWLPCICGKKPCIIGKTKKTSLHLLSLVFNASQYFGMEVQYNSINLTHVERPNFVFLTHISVVFVSDFFFLYYI